MISHRPRRSCLYMPGSNTKAMDKARSLPADVVIFDLEDAVAPEAKAEARANVVTSVKAGGFGAREVVIRVNGLQTPWGAEDLEAVATAGADAILVPKIDRAEDVHAANALLEGPGTPRLWVMIETPQAILNIEAIAAARGHTRLDVFVMGTNDLAKETRALLKPGRRAFHAALSLSVLAGRAHGIEVIDGVFNDIADAQGFATQCEEGVEFGFDGKTLIHPSQIDPCNTIFAPPMAEVAYARAVIDAFAAPENSGKGVLKVEGRMTELLHLEIAKRTVAVADAIAARE
jgi:citrate lyase subunit beta / citryl-CoA lyase